MTRVTVKFVESGQPDDTAPPAGTAIVRPLRHVRAVRERYLQRFAGPAEALDDLEIDARVGEQLRRAGYSAIMLPPSKPIRDLLLKAGGQRTAWAVSISPARSR